MRSNANFDVVKEPRGFIKCLEIFLAIFAFSCATGFRASFSFYQYYEDNGSAASHRVDGSFKYPFDGSVKLSMINITLKTENVTHTDYVDVPLPIDQRHSTEFFVVIGVFCFLYSLAVLVYYIWFEPEDKTAPTSILSKPVVEFGIGVFWAFFWFVSACALASAENKMKDATDLSDFFGRTIYCKGDLKCEIISNVKYATLTVAVLLGFLNVFVWVGNMWFLWKETPWHNNTASQQAATVQQQQQQQQQHQTPPAAAI